MLTSNEYFDHSVSFLCFYNLLGSYLIIFLCDAIECSTNVNLLSPCLIYFGTVPLFFLQFWFCKVGTAFHLIQRLITNKINGTASFLKQYYQYFCNRLVLKLLYYEIYQQKNINVNLLSLPLSLILYRTIFSVLLAFQGFSRVDVLDQRFTKIVTRTHWYVYIRTTTEVVPSQPIIDS